MKDLKESRIILEIDIYRDLNVETLNTSQCRYAAETIKKFGLQNVRGFNTPMAPAIDVIKSSPARVEPYRETIGSLMYLAVETRPDLA